MTASRLRAFALSVLLGLVASAPSIEPRAATLLPAIGCTGLIQGHGTATPVDCLPPPIAPANATALNTAIAAAIAAGQPGVSLVPGTYSVAKTVSNGPSLPYGIAAAVLVNAPCNFTLDGQGSTLSLIGADVSSYADILHFQNAPSPACRTTVKNLKVQYASPPFAQAVLSSTSACSGNANGSATFAMYSGFAPAWVSVTRIDQYNPNPNPVTGTVGLFVTNNYRDPASGIPITSLGGGNYSLAFNGTEQCNALAGMTNGFSYSLMSTQFGVNGVGYDGLVFYKMANVSLDNVQVVDAAGHGITFIGANDITLTNGTGVIAAAGAVKSSNGGGIAAVYASGVFTADPSTRTSFTGDDGLFIGPYTTAIVSVTSRTSIIVSGSPFMNVGETVQFIDPSGEMLGSAIVAGLTPTSGNTTISLFGTGAPSGIPLGSSGNTWVIADKSQAPSQCIISGTYGESPTRGIFADCGQEIFNQPTIRNTGAGAIYSAYNDGNIGIVPDQVTFNQPSATNVNYANDSFDAAIEVAGWGWNSAAVPPARNGAATAGQIGTVTVNNPFCKVVGTGCVYIGSAKEVSVTFGSYQTWYQVAGTPGNTQACGSNMYEYALAFCNDLNVGYTPQHFLSTGLQETYSGSTVSNPQTSNNLGDTGPWTTYTPTVVFTGGACTGVWGAVTGRYKTVLSNTTIISMSATLTTAGNCSGNLIFSLPNTSVNAGGFQNIIGGEDVNTSDALRGAIAPNAGSMLVVGAAVTLPVANGDKYDMTGSYENQ